MDVDPKALEAAVVAVTRNIPAERGFYAPAIACAAVEAYLRDLLTPETVRHRKRGGVYAVITRKAELQSSAPLSEPATLVVYQGRDGRMWVRPVSEFDDGRFERVVDRSVDEEG